jgi:ABC-type nitrate/sulfonate/bicarbonate transport system substrate-binding protein
MRSRILGIAFAMAAFGIGAEPAGAQTEVKMISFGGGSNLPTYVALDRGFFTKEGLKVTFDRTKGSREQIRDLMEGKYQFATTAFDNIVAYTEGQGRDTFDNFDLVAIMGSHKGFNSVVVRPEIKSYKDIKGKALAVDSPKSGYATMMYEIIKNKTGYVQGKDYTVNAVGGTGARVKALKEGAAVIAAISSPDDLRLKAQGFPILGDAAQEIGAYQGSVHAVRRSWAKSNEKTVLAYIRATIAAIDFVYANKPGAIEVLRGRVNNLSQETAEQIYQGLTAPGGLNVKGQLNMKGIETVLALRKGAGSKAGVAAKYTDTSYYAKVANRH